MLAGAASAETFGEFCQPSNCTCLIVYPKYAPHRSRVGEGGASVARDNELVVSLPRNWSHVRTSALQLGERRATLLTYLSPCQSAALGRGACVRCHDQRHNATDASRLWVMMTGG